MSILNWAEKRAQNMKWYHFSSLKIGVAAFALFIAKIYPDILSLNWYWYAGVFAIAYIILLFGFFDSSKN